MLASMLASMLTLLISLEAHAQSPSCHSQEPFLDIELVGEWSPGDKGAIFAELQSALRVQSLGLCVGGRASSRAIARVRLEHSDADTVTIVVSDGVTDKEVRREVHLAAFDAAARSLALAVAADELVRASWAELILEDSPVRVEDTPPSVQRVVQRTVERSPTSGDRASERWLSLGATIDGYTGGELQFGGTLQFERWLGERVAFRLGGSGRVGIERQGELGSVQSRSVLGDVDVVGRLFGASEGLSMVLYGGVQFGWIRFESSANAGALASDESSLLVGARAGLGLVYSFGVLRLSLEFGGGAPLLGAAALDGERTLTAVSGAHLFGALSFGVRL